MGLAPTCWKCLLTPIVAVSEERWALFVGAVTVLTLRFADFFLPRGWHSLWLKRHAFKDEENNDVDE